jgi:hypothetical protein
LTLRHEVMAEPRLAGSLWTALQALPGTKSAVVGARERKRLILWSLWLSVSPGCDIRIER